MTKTRRWPIRFGVTVLAVEGALIAIHMPVVGGGFGSLLFLAVLISAWYGGVGAGLLATALTAVTVTILVAIYNVVFPAHMIIGIVLFVAGGVLISVLVEALHSARQRAEASRSWLSAVLNSIADAIIATDARGRVTFANPVACHLTGWDQDQAEGMPLEHVYRIVSEETREPAEHLFSRVLREGKVIAHGDSKLLVARDGTERPITDNAAPIRDEVGAIGGVVLAFRDVAENRRWEEALRRSELATRQLNAELEQRVAQRTAQLESANKELEAFSYSVAHDLRAPLRSIEGFSRILLDKYPDRLGDAGKDYLERVVRAAKRMEQVIADLLNLSRLTRSEMRHTTVDLSELAEAVAAELRLREPQRRAEFVIAQGVVACGDARLLRFVLDNLLGNAWKFTGSREAARIEFGVVPGNGRTNYFVSDNGVGFDMAYEQKLFNPFQRLHSDREFPGTGVGLATVQRIVGRHGGRAWAEGEVGKGATFYFTLCNRSRR